MFEGVIYGTRLVAAGKFALFMALLLPFILVGTAWMALETTVEALLEFLLKIRQDRRIGLLQGITFIVRGRLECVVFAALDVWYAVFGRFTMQQELNIQRVREYGFSLILELSDADRAIVDRLEELCEDCADEEPDSFDVPRLRPPFPIREDDPYLRFGAVNAEGIQELVRKVERLERWFPTRMPPRPLWLTWLHEQAVAFARDPRAYVPPEGTEVKVTLSPFPIPMPLDEPLDDE